MRFWLATLAAGCTLLLHTAQAQENFPNRPVRLVVPYAAGGTTDALGRIVAQKLSEQWGQNVYLDFKPGAGTVIGAGIVASAPADGYTWLLAVNTHVINEFLMAKLPYHPIKDFTPLATLSKTDYILLVNSALPVKSLQEFIATAKAKPDAINFGTHGVGGLTHVAVSLFESQAGIKLNLVPYKGTALPGMLTGEVQTEFDALASTLPHIQAGKLIPLATTGTNRMKALPEVPTFKEAGVPDFDVTIWYGLLGPAGVPKPIVDKIQAGVAKALASPEAASKMGTLGLETFVSNADDFGKMMKADSIKYGEVIRKANIKAE
jgi:tripartite-type tricarboxylate transporter receptor subunit TctC